MELLRHLAVGTPRLIGSPYSFLMAIVLVAAWVVWGVLAGFSTKWLLWPSAVASVFTFVIVFSLQYTQNRDTRAIQLKLDEIMRASDARTELVKLGTLSDHELAEVEAEILRLRRAS